MTLFLSCLITGVLAFALGLWVAQHPDDARSLWQMIRDRFKRKPNA